MTVGAAFDSCWRILKDAAAEKDCEVTVSTQSPLVRGPYTSEPFVCPHGVEYWVEPTGEQIARWARKGVR